MRDIHIDSVDHLPCPIIAIGRKYSSGHVVARHQHRRGQLLSSASGVIVLTAPAGTWVMPPQRGMWIPPATPHTVQMIGKVDMQSLYLEPDAVPGMPVCCQVVGISPFMRGLMTEALELPFEYDVNSRAGALMTLIGYEMRQMPILPLSLPFPSHEGLAARCKQFVERPSVHESIDDWRKTLGMSRRAFTRLFRNETGLSFMSWRQQACLMFAMQRLIAGKPVTAVAMEVGYDNPAAFTTMFKRSFGAPPLNYLGLRQPAG